MDTILIRLFCLGIFPILMLKGCSEKQISPMEGAWKLSYEYEIKGEETTCIFPGKARGSEIKMWAGNRWSLVGVFVEDSVITDNYGGGTFTLDGTEYREIVEYHSAPEYLNQTVRLHLEIKDDTLTQIWPVDGTGAPDVEHHYMEKWVRME